MNHLTNSVVMLELWLFVIKWFGKKTFFAGSVVRPGIVRCGEHSDYGTVTILFQVRAKFESKPPHQISTGTPIHPGQSWGP